MYSGGDTVSELLPLLMGSCSGKVACGPER